MANKVLFLSNIYYFERQKLPRRMSEAARRGYTIVGYTSDSCVSSVFSRCLCSRTSLHLAFTSFTLSRQSSHRLEVSQCSGGFRHVQHVRSNRDPHKKGPPQEERQIFCMPKIMGDTRVNECKMNKSIKATAMIRRTDS